MKKIYHQKAVLLRKNGYTYSEILRQVPVAKSTLSLWLRKVGLAKEQKQKLSVKKLAAAQRGWQSRKNHRLAQIDSLYATEQAVVGKISHREAFLIGTALYWAEGSKQKDHNVSARVNFDNTDARMVMIFMIWLDTICNVKKEDLVFQLYIHQSGDTAAALLYWRNNLNIPDVEIRVYFKKNAVKTNRKNTGVEYHGLMRVTVRRSTKLNRKISAWIFYIANGYGEWCSGNTPVFGTG
jgi:hypothetical protein